MVSWRVTFTDAFSDSLVIRHGHVADLPFDEVLQYVWMIRKWFKVLRWPERRLIERGTYRWPRTWILRQDKKEADNGPLDSNYCSESYTMDHKLKISGKLVQFVTHGVQR